jgi:two-component system, OmpR family, sensor histidine kinase KdpD
MAHRDRVFVPSSGSATPAPPWLGVGLALSRGLVEAMAGTLVLEGTPGGGLTVAISLPAAAATAPQPEIRS